MSAHTPRQNPSSRTGIALAAALCSLFAFTGPANAEPRPSSDLLLPYFEVSLESPLTTLFAATNSHEAPVDVEMTLFSNWGVEILRTSTRLNADQVRTVNLADWIVGGRLLDRDLAHDEILHVQAALSGEASPRDGLYYGTPTAPGLTVGFLEIRVAGSPRPDSLWGDYFLVNAAEDFAQGDVLANIDRLAECGDLCLRHALRYLNGGGFDGGTQIIIWTGERGQPSADPVMPPSRRTFIASEVYDEPGNHVDERSLNLLPVEIVTVADLGLAVPFGWLDLTTEKESFIAVRYSASNRFSVGLTSHCLPVRREPGPGIRIEKATNGIDADLAPGLGLALGAAIEWTYAVTNTGEVPLSDIRVTDDQGVRVSCPHTSLEPGESMTCTGSGLAAVCSYRNIGTVRATPPSGTDVFDSDASHYSVAENAGIAIEKATNGHDADSAPGPELNLGQAVTWSYAVTNTGDAPLDNVSVTDDQGVAVSCPKATLAVGESMTCTGHGTAVEGQYRNVGTATGETACGAQVADSDASHYHTEAPCTDAPAIAIEKATNGHDADTGPGPEIVEGSGIEWTYVVTNTGNVPLAGLAVTDDQGVAVTCPGTSLAPGQSMTCTGSGTATVGPYQNIGTATATSVGNCPQGVSSSDPSHYTGVPEEEPCNACDGKVTELTMQFLGGASAHVQVLAKRGPSTDEVFNGTLAPGEVFELIGPAGGTPGHAGTLGTEIRMIVDGVLQTTIHTSCSTPIGPGLVSGDFLVLEGSSSGGGLLCPL